jgi:hypothetical protein
MWEEGGTTANAADVMTRRQRMEWSNIFMGALSVGRAFYRPPTRFNNQPSLKKGNGSSGELAQ